MQSKGKFAKRRIPGVIQGLAVGRMALPDRMQRLQAYTFFVWPFKTSFCLWRLGLKIRLEDLWEWL